MPLDGLVTLRSNEGVKTVIGNRSFWKAKLEQETCAVFPDADIQWYTVHKLHADAKLQEVYKLLYSSNPDDVRAALYLNKICAVDVEVDNVHPGNIHTPLIGAISHNNLESMLVLLEDPRVNPYGEKSNALNEATEGWVSTTILSSLLAINNPDVHGKITEALSRSINYACVEAVKILLADKRADTSSLKYTAYYRFLKDEETLRIVLEDKRVNVGKFAASLFTGSHKTRASLYATLALEYDRKQAMRSITREMYIELLHSRLVDDTLPLFILDEFARDGYTLTQGEKDYLVREIWTGRDSCCRTDRETDEYRKAVMKALNAPRPLPVSKARPCQT